MAVDQRLSKLEMTVAQGFLELNGRMGAFEGRMGAFEGRMGAFEGRMGAFEGRMDAFEGRLGRVEDRMGRIENSMERLEDRVDAMNAKLDVVSETLSDKMQLVLERLDAHTNEMRVTMAAIVQEHRADRRLMYSMLKDHGVRIRALEEVAGPADTVPERPTP